jgi:hypothetical protein
LTRSVIRKARALVQARETPMDRRAAQDRFLLFWLGIPLLVFVLARSKLPLYLLPLFVPMALLTAREFNAASHAWTRRRAAFISAWGILLIASRVIATEIPTKKNAAVLAAAIEAANPAPFTEVAFFANLPLLGLNFYLDKEVEAVSADTLSDELGEEESRLWLVSPAESGILLSATAQLNVELQLLGKVDERYLLFQELPK